MAQSLTRSTEQATRSPATITDSSTSARFAQQPEQLHGQTGTSKHCRTPSTSQVVTAETKGTSNSRSSKRQRTVGESSQHKFIKQKKWNFIDGQTWVPSKLSSKAQNASKITGRYRVEPTASEQMHEAGTTTFTQQASIRGQSARMYSGITGVVEPSFQSCSSNPMSQSANLSCLPQMQTMQRASRADQQVRSSTLSAEPPESLPPTLPSSRDLGDDSPLSLEKDAARIAALIAVKKEENESTMFRQRLLQRQIIHKNRQDKVVTAEDTLLVQPSYRSVYVSENSGAQEGFERYLSSSYMDTSQPSPQSPSVEELQMLYSPSQSADGSMHADTDEDDMKMSPNRSMNDSQAMVRSMMASNDKDRNSAQEVRKMLFGKPSIELDVSKRSCKMGETERQLSETSLNPNCSGPFECEDAYILAQLTAFSDQLVTTNANPDSQSHGWNRCQPAIDHTPIRQFPSSMPHSRARLQARTQSTPCIVGSRLADESVALTDSSPSALSPSSPSGEAAQQIAYMSISSSSKCLPLSTSSTYKGKIILGERAPVLARSYSSTDGQMSSKLARHVSSSNTPGSDKQLPSSLQSQPSDTTDQKVRQHNPPQADKASKLNTTSESVFKRSKRASSHKHKTRVNMFGDIKGTPLSTWEVIKQIEMT